MQYLIKNIWHLVKKKTKELLIKQAVMAIKQNKSKEKSQKKLAKILASAKLKYRIHFLSKRDAAHLLTPLYEIEKELCEMSTNALRQKSISDFSNNSDQTHAYLWFILLK